MLFLLQSHVVTTGYTAPTFSGFYQPVTVPSQETDDDDELLLAWFMFMRQPHE